MKTLLCSLNLMFFMFSKEKKENRHVFPIFLVLLGFLEQKTVFKNSKQPCPPKGQVKHKIITWFHKNHQPDQVQATGQIFVQKHSLSPRSRNTKNKMLLLS